MFSVIFYWLAGLNFFIDIQFSSNLFTGQTTDNVVSGLACVASVSEQWKGKEPDFRFWALSLTLLRHSLLRNRMETLATQAVSGQERIDVSFFLLSVTIMRLSRQRALTSERNERSVEREKKC